MHMGWKRSAIGWPEIPEHDEVLHHLAKLCERYGTKLDIADWVGIIKLK